MQKQVWLCIAIIALLLTSVRSMWGGDESSSPKPKFQTSDRCVACHNGMKTQAGEDFSIGVDGRASIMANSARDPYWQGSVRRETIDHPEASADIQDECSTCHMPAQPLVEKTAGRKSEVFSRLPLKENDDRNHLAIDGVTCSVCHQVESTGLGTHQTF